MYRISMTLSVPAHLTNAAAGVLILWQDKQKAQARHNNEEVDDDKPDFILSVAKNRFAPFQGAIGLYQHEKARLLCNSRARQYKPIILEDTCQSDERPTGESGLGELRRYFSDEEDARDFARDRANDPDNWDGIPFVDQIDENELPAPHNSLEASNQ